MPCAQVWVAQIVPLLGRGSHKPSSPRVRADEARQADERKRHEELQPVPPARRPAAHANLPAAR